MHTPDGFITSWICVLMLALSALPVLVALKRLERSRIPMIAGVASLIFLAQMINFPISGFSSGHLIGAGLAVALLGLDAAIIAMAMVLVVQTFVFGDGGALALGVNIFTMGISAVYAASFVYEKTGSRFLSSSFSVVAAASVLSVLLAMSGVGSFVDIAFAMLAVHAIIALAEGALTHALLSVSPMRITAGTVGIALALTAVLIPLSSGNPDGLETVSLHLGFFDKAVEVYEAPLAGYLVPLALPYLGSVLAAAIGIIFTYVIPYSFLEVRQWFYAL